MSDRMATPNLPIRHWTLDEDEHLLHLRDTLKQKWKEIAEALGKSVKAVRMRHACIRLTPEQRIARALYQRERRRRLGLLSGRRREPRGPPPPKHNPDLDRRIMIVRELQHSSLSAELLGDPPIGRSALDARNGTLCSERKNHMAQIRPASSGRRISLARMAPAPNP
jgi:hypothetical protein